MNIKSTLQHRPQRCSQREWVIAMVLAVGLLVIGIGWAAPAPVHATTELTEIELVNIASPNPEEEPVSIIDWYLISENMKLSLSNTYWVYYNDEEDLWHQFTGSRFKAGELYALRCVIDPEPGYEFSKNPVIKVNCEEFGVTDVQTFSDGHISFKCIFPRPYIVSEGSVNVYSEPSMKSSTSQIIGTLKFGEIVESPAYPSEIWCPIRYDGQDGYVPRNQLALTYRSELASYAYVVNDSAGALNVRDDMGGSRIGGLTLGDTVMTTSYLMGAGGEWWYTFDYEGKLGFVMAKYLTKTDFPLKSLTIQNIPQFYTAKGVFSMPHADWDQVVTEDKHIEYDKSDGSLWIHIVPCEGTSLANITKDDIILPAEAGYVIKSADYSTQYKRIVLVVLNQWTNDTGKVMKMQQPKLKAGKKKVTVKWTKDPNANGYFILYSYNSDMSDYQLKKVTKAGTTSTTIKNLKKGKKVYFKIASYVEYAGYTYTGAMMDWKSVKVK